MWLSSGLLVTTKTISPVRSLAPRMRTDVVSSGVGEPLYRNPWSRVVMEKLTVSQIVMKFPYPKRLGGWGGVGWKRRYMILFKRTHHLCLVRDINLNHALLYFFFKPNMAVILELMPAYSNCSHFFRVSLQNLLRMSLLSLMLHTPLSSQPNSSDDPNSIS